MASMPASIGCAYSATNDCSSISNCATMIRCSKVSERSKAMTLRPAATRPSAACCRRSKAGQRMPPGSSPGAKAALPRSMRLLTATNASHCSACDLTPSPTRISFAARSKPTKRESAAWCRESPQAGAGRPTSPPIATRANLLPRAKDCRDARAVTCSILIYWPMAMLSMCQRARSAPRPAQASVRARSKAFRDARVSSA